jgi:Fic family protein
MRDLPKPPKLAFLKLATIIKRLDEPQVQPYIEEANNAYLHWDKLRYHKTPTGLTPEEGWHLVGFSRRSRRRTLPLLDQEGKPFSYWVPDPALAILHEVDRGAGGILGAVEGTADALGPMRNRVLVSSLMEEAIATSQIEGAITTHKVAKEMLRTNRKPRDRSEQMIVNSYQTINLLRQRQDEPLTLALLLDVQERMTRNTLDDPSAAGRFRTATEQIEEVDSRDGEVVYTPPPAGELPQRIEALLAYANAPPGGDSFVHPLVKATILHFWLAYEHPFVDGNGRTARALLYWFMLKSGYWLFEFLTISRVINDAPMQYYRSFLYSEQDNNDLTYSIVFQLGATQRALTQLKSYIAEKQAIAAVLNRIPELNPRQRALLEHALKHPGQVYTFQGHANYHDVTLLTARKHLLNLKDRGLLVETKQGYKRTFVAADNLAERLGVGAIKSKRRTIR